ncbi:uncharacterized protein PITG_01747 [Phytophthora infestans T30-4]|uniref:Uncharacterized protein n=1 Tax=Phytophthora infestans (strain T30-4) TaxID=403677 RepID=D0MTZ9_PHYIT|nr:uncharacterized protein PITG_01747 [Phytophthora infestans T30-4]EEY61446.1 conserved hypothetical protein [Phytophthora infestans T30-4]|eukprot:XP_002908363.1 conserved hypothetical protein [Phytophthora infestans T30-4]
MCPRLRSDTAQDPINKRRGGQMGVRAVEYSAVATREVVKTISEKCQVLGKMLEASRVKLHSAEEIAQDSIFAQTPLLQEMNRVFEQLQGTCVDPHMVGGERGKTLFDFVDAETVQSLQQDALEQTKEVEELLAAHQHAIRRIAAIYRFFVTFDKAHGSNVDALVGEHRELASIADEDAKPIGELYNAAVCTVHALLSRTGGDCSHSAANPGWLIYCRSAFSSTWSSATASCWSTSPLLTIYTRSTF